MRYYEPIVDFIFLIDTTYKTVNPTKETKMKLEIQGWSFKNQKDGLLVSQKTAAA